MTNDEMTTGEAYLIGLKDGQKGMAIYVNSWLQKQYALGHYDVLPDLADLQALAAEVLADD